MNLTLKLLVISVLLIVLVPVSLPTVDAANGDTATQAIDQAEETITSAYEAVLEAEKAGANVTDLVNILNEAGWLLSKAHQSYGMGNFDSAQDFAVECKGSLTGFSDEAEALKQSADREQNWDFQINVVGSAVGALAIVAGGFVAWIVLKRKHGKVNI